MAEASPGLEIERKFLLAGLPPEARRGVRILQGYLSGPGACPEIRVRAYGRRHYLTLKTGAAMIRTETEVPLSRGAFDALWPHTGNARVHKTRYRVRHGRYVLEIDEYLDLAEPLVTADVELPSATATGLDLPGWMGNEITGLAEFSNASLARKGLPDSYQALRPSAGQETTKYITHVGAVPYRWNKGRLEILCITSRSRKRWIVPKGRWDDGVDLPEVALKEALEEGGVRGELGRGGLGICEDQRDGYVDRILLYSMEVTEVLEKWPEMAERERQWLTAKAAADTVSCPGLARLLMTLPARLNRPQPQLNRSYCDSGTT